MRWGGGLNTLVPPLYRVNTHPYNHEGVGVSPVSPPHCINANPNNHEGGGLKTPVPPIYTGLIPIVVLPDM